MKKKFENDKQAHGAGTMKMIRSVGVGRFTAPCTKSIVHAVQKRCEIVGVW